MIRAIDSLHLLFGSWWFPPSLVMIISLAGIVSITVDPCCYVSGNMKDCEFAFDNAWRHYPGKWGGIAVFWNGIPRCCCAFLLATSS